LSLGQGAGRADTVPSTDRLVLRPDGAPDAAGVAASAAAVVTSFDLFRAPLAPDERRDAG
jgi:hypothetical protein